MKRVLLIILIVVVSLGVLAAAAGAGYRFGYARGALQSQDRADTLFGHYDRFFGPNDMPGRGFHQGGFDPHHKFGHGDFTRAQSARGFGFHSPISLLLRIAVFGLIVWVVYLLFKGNGWQLTLTRVQSQTPPTAPAEPAVETKADRQ